MPAHQAWNVYLHGKRIDTVFFDRDISADDVRCSLINHDGYDPAITVRRCNRYEGAPMSEQQQWQAGYDAGLIDGRRHIPASILASVEKLRWTFPYAEGWLQGVRTSRTLTGNSIIRTLEQRA